jgi:hypothetical protein
MFTPLLSEPVFPKKYSNHPGFLDSKLIRICKNIVIFSIKIHKVNL